MDGAEEHWKTHEVKARTKDEGCVGGTLKRTLS